jgi:hypothetical protein
MAEIRQIGQTGWRQLLGVGSMGLALTVATGCTHTPTAATVPADPLTGTMTPPGTPPPTGVPKTSAAPPPSPSYQNGLAPIGPNDLSAANNATLASMSGGPLGRPQPDDPYHAPAQAQFTSNPKEAPPQTGYPAPNPNPKVEPIPDANPTPSKLGPGGWQTDPSVNAGVQPASASNAATTEALTRQLQDHGVVNQEINQLSDGIHLTCYVPRPTGGFRKLEVTATDYATAVQAILQQLDAPPMR